VGTQVVLPAADWALTDPSADRHALPLSTFGGSLHDPLRSPVIDPRCLAAASIDAPSRCNDGTAITVSTGL
jgi:hypothetical protein